MRKWIKHTTTKYIDVAPLVTFRILFGITTFISTLRFLLLGWVDLHFVDTKVQFKYFGFEWVKLLPAEWMYAIHILMLMASIGIVFGAFYRISAIVFFFCFTFCELIDITYYLNHYYFVSIIALLMCLVPANVNYALDSWRNPTIRQSKVPAWTINIFKIQLIFVYFFAGIAKINYDWLVEALPLKIWLPANNNLPLVGRVFNYTSTAYIFSWAGMFFDISIGYFLLNNYTRIWGWLLLVFFHLITGLLFQIGVFPLVMIAVTVIFFDNNVHHRLQLLMQLVFKLNGRNEVSVINLPYYEKSLNKMWLLAFFVTWFAFHLLFPLRYLLYPGNLCWTEEGYRFSWRVMLMEKAGTATFYVTDDLIGKEGVVDNKQFLNLHQEKQMAMQPDLILQYAQFLKNHYESLGSQVSKVRAEVYVTLNAKPSKLLMADTLNLLTVSDSWKPKTWIFPLDEK